NEDESALGWYILLTLNAKAKNNAAQEGDDTSCDVECRRSHGSFTDIHLSAHVLVAHLDRTSRSICPTTSSISWPSVEMRIASVAGLSGAVARVESLKSRSRRSSSTNAYSRFSPWRRMF